MSKFKMEHKNPEGLFSAKFFSQMVTVSGKAKTIYIGGQKFVEEIQNPPLITVLFVSGFALPGCLIEIDGIAAIESDID